MNTVGNIISGQVLGDTARQLSDRIGKIMQKRQSMSINSGDTSFSHSKQLEMAVPPATIAQLSSGEFVGMVADDPQEKIVLKAFHCEIINAHEKIAREEASFEEIPKVRDLNQGEVLENYHRIKAEISRTIESEMERMLDTPALAGMVIQSK